MKILLGAVQCEKGDLSGNLARHVALMKEAHRFRCELVVFPEFSLTGSVDPRAHPDRALSVEHPAVAELVDATAAVGVGVVFGLAEHRDGDFFITQAFAVSGELFGVQRKRCLGEGEEAYTASSETAVFELGAARFGAIICAESGVDFTWNATVAAGAQVVFMTSAPGLHGRRVSEADWRAGFGWWESCGLADARRHAARLGVWVAMATQAGSTLDEDFPGIAALIAPNGDVVERLPDWRPGHLIVDVPVVVDVDPVRWSVRVLLIDEAGRTLLAQFGDDRTGQRWWVPPGGGIEAGEDDLACARRELLEEVGRNDLPIGPCIGRRGGGRRKTSKPNRSEPAHETSPASSDKFTTDTFRTRPQTSASEPPLRQAPIARTSAPIPAGVMGGDLRAPTGGVEGPVPSRHVEALPSAPPAHRRGQRGK